VEEEALLLACGGGVEWCGRLGFWWGERDDALIAGASFPAALDSGGFGSDGRYMGPRGARVGPHGLLPFTNGVPPWRLGWALYFSSPIRFLSVSPSFLSLSLSLVAATPPLPPPEPRKPKPTTAGEARD
jgi:hypothetical protein